MPDPSHVGLTPAARKAQLSRAETPREAGNTHGLGHPTPEFVGELPAAERAWSHCVVPTSETLPKRAWQSGREGSAINPFRPLA